MRRMLLTLLAALLLSAATAVPAFAHYNGVEDEVLLPAEWLVYKDYSKYNVRAGASRWDALNCRWAYGGSSCPGVDLDEYLVDTGGAQSPTLKVYDQYVRNAGWAGMVRRTGTHLHYMYINTYYADHYAGWQLQNLFNHEFGHTVSLDHTPETSYYYSRSVMAPCSICHKSMGYSLGSHDYSDYYRIWVQNIR